MNESFGSLTFHPHEGEPLAELGGDDQEDGLRVRKLLHLLTLFVDVIVIVGVSVGFSRILRQRVIG